MPDPERRCVFAPAIDAREHSCVGLVSDYRLSRDESLRCQSYGLAPWGTWLKAWGLVCHWALLDVLVLSFVPVTWLWIIDDSCTES